MKAPKTPILTMVLVAASLATATPAPDQPGIAGLVKELGEMDVPAEAGSDYVPPAATPLMKALKSELRVLITKVINSSEVSRLEPAGMELAVSSALESEGVLVVPDSPSGVFGAIEEIHFERPSKTSSLLVARFSLSIPCGSDSSVYLYRRTAHGWALILVRGRQEPEDLGGILDHPQTHLVSVESETNPLLIISTIPPWCTSCWSAVWFELLRPGPDADHPHSIFRGDVSTYRCNDEPHVLTTDSSGFTLVTEDMSDDKPTDHATHIRRYAITGEEVRVVSETELLIPRFVENWSRLPWGKASRQIAPSRRAKLHKWHRRISHPEAVTYLGSYKLVPPARGGKIQVGAACMVTGPDTALPLYFTFQLDRDRFVLWDISETTPTGTSQLSKEAIWVQK